MARGNHIISPHRRVDDIIRYVCSSPAQYVAKPTRKQTKSSISDFRGYIQDICERRAYSITRFLTHAFLLDRLIRIGCLGVERGNSHGDEYNKGCAHYVCFHARNIPQSCATVNNFILKKDSLLDSHSNSNGWG